MITSSSPCASAWLTVRPRHGTVNEGTVAWAAGLCGEESFMPSPELRASDADRQVVVADLQRHYADGRLTTEELRERIGLAMASRTYSDLEELQRDLPRAVSVAQASTAACCNTSSP